MSKFKCAELKKKRPSAVTSENKLSQNIIYALPELPLYLLVLGPLSVIPGLAVKYFGLTLGAIALAQFLSRVFDGITDPAVGYFSDRYQQRFGTRKPMIVVGGVLVLIASTMLYIPYGWDPQHPEPISFAYFLGFYLIFTLAWTVMEIPHLAWGAEITSDAKGRSQRFSFRSIASLSAPMIFFIIPLLPVFETTEVTPETLKYAVYLSWVLMPLCLWICMRWVPNAPVDHSVKVSIHALEQSQQLSKKQRFLKVAGLITGNRPLLVFYIAFGLGGLGFSMSNGLTFFFVDNYLGIAEKLPYAFLVSFAVGVPAAWCWGFLAPKIGARSTWLIGMSLGALGLLGVSSLGPGSSSFWPYLICKGLIGAGLSSNFVAGYIVLANIADYGKWKFDQDCSATYFSLCKTIFKLNSSVGVAIGLLIAGWLGFDPLAEEMSEAAKVALKFAYIVLPLVFIILSIVVIARIPLNTHQQSVIRKRLEARALRVSH